MEWQLAMQSLAHDPVAPVYTVLGTEHTLSRRWLRALQARMNRDSGQTIDFNRFDFEEEGCDNALLTCTTVSLFSDSSVVLLDACSFLLTTNKAKHDISELENYLENPIPGRVLILRVVADKLDERKRIVKQAKKYPLISCVTPKQETGLLLVSELLKEKQSSMTREAIGELWRRCNSISLVEMELEKLSAFTAGRQIELSDVEQLVAKPIDDNVFSWIDGVVKGNLKQSFQSLADVQSAGYDGFALMALMAKQVRTMWYARVLGEQGLSHAQIAKRMSVHPYSVKVAAEQARLVSAKKLETLLTTLADAEFWVKSGRWEIGQALDYVVLASTGLIPKRPGKRTG